MNTLPLNVPASPGAGMSAEGRGATPQRGRGTRLTVNAMGFAYSSAGGGRGWPHHFKPSLGSGGISFSRGYVFGAVKAYEPTIDGKKISTGVQLRLEADVADAAGESWACIKVWPNAKGVLEQPEDSESVVQMVHSGAPLSIDPEFGLQPVAMILWIKGRPSLVHEVLMYDVRYQLGSKPGERPARHFFL